MRTPFVSIILPVYNVESFLSQCIDSILSQTFRDFELILIDDGSTDCSYLICSSYLSIDNRVRFLHKKNEGVSSARNIGIELSIGEYIIFVDPDDYWISKDCLNFLVYNVRYYNLDILRCTYITCNENGEFGNKQRMYIKNEQFEISTSFYNSFIDKGFFIWMSLIRRSEIEKRNIRFNTDYIFLEDMEFYIHLFNKASKYMYIPYVFYVYRQRTTSVTYNYTPRHLNNILQLYQFVYEKRLRTDGSEIIIIDFIFNKLLNLYIWIISNSSNLYKQKGIWYEKLVKIERISYYKFNMKILFYYFHFLLKKYLS